MKFIKNWIIFGVIILIAIFFRSYNLSSVPPSPSLDEVTIGYNAYSILQTGHDEYGYKFPILLRAYDDYRPALYVYLVIPFVQVFGLTVLAVRMPSVILSLITVIATYFLAKELCKNSFLKLEIRNWKLEIPEIAMFFIAISPWHIYISRLGHEVNAGSTFGVLGILFFIVAANNIKHKFFLCFSAFFLSLSFYTYQSEKVFIPLLVVGLVLFFWKKIIVLKKASLLATIIFILMTIPIFKASLSPEGLIRLHGTSAFTNLDEFYSQSAKQLVLDKKNRNVVGELLDNRRIIPVKVFFSNYFSHLNLLWLYTNSGNEDFKIPNVGLFYVWECIFLVSGFFFLWKIHVANGIKRFIVYWVIIAFIAPSITTQAPHAMRSYTLLPIPQIIEGIGITEMFAFASMRKNIFSQLIFSIIFFACVFYSFSSLYHNYFYTFPKTQSRPYQYALSKSMEYVLKNESTYNKIVFSNENNMYQSYMFYLFASKYNPALYYSQGGSISGGFAETHKFGKYEFRPIHWQKESRRKNTLFIGNPNDFPGNNGILFRGNYLDGKEGVWVVK